MRRVANPRKGIPKPKLLNLGCGIIPQLHSEAILPVDPSGVGTGDIIAADLVARSTRWYLVGYVGAKPAAAASWPEAVVGHPLRQKEAGTEVRPQLRHCEHPPPRTRQTQSGQRTDRDKSVCAFASPFETVNPGHDPRVRRSPLGDRAFRSKVRATTRTQHLPCKR